MHIVNPRTGNVLGIDYVRMTDCRKDAQALADEMGISLEIHSAESIDIVEPSEDAE